MEATVLKTRTFLVAAFVFVACTFLLQIARTVLGEGTHAWMGAALVIVGMLIVYLNRPE